MDDDLHDLTPDRRPAPDPGDAAAATAVRTALDAGRPPVDPERLLAGVQARATRRHRRRQAVTSLAAAVAVAGVITAGVALPGGAPSTSPSRDGVPPAADGPSTTAPLPTASDPATSSRPPAAGPAAGPVTAASMLTLADVGEVIPDARGVEAAGPRPRAAGDPVVGGVCTDDVLAGVPEPTADLTALWTESGAVGLPASVREDLLSWGSAAGAAQYAAASAAAGQVCAAQAAAASAAGGTSETAGYRLVTPPAALGSGSVVAVAAEAPRLWRVRVVAARGTVAVSLSASLRGPATPAGADAAAAQAAGLAATALDRAAGR